MGSTYKTLGEVEPRIPIGPETTPGDAGSLYKITQPGSYYLTGNIAGAPGKHGIEVETTGAVTIDLSGFEMVGAVGLGLPATQSGIYVSTVQARLTLRNGTVRGWGEIGVRAITSLGSIIEGVRAEDNVGRGINAADGVVVRNCVAAYNDGGGIYVGAGCTISNCTARGNGNFGINGGTSSVIEVRRLFNTDHGITVASHSLVSRCTSSNNAADGFRFGANNRIIDCIANVNTGAGIHATIGGNDIQGNSVQGNIATGIDADSGGNFIARNTAKGNGTNYVPPGRRRSARSSRRRARSPPPTPGRTFRTDGLPARAGGRAGGHESAFGIDVQGGPDRAGVDGSGPWRARPGRPVGARIVADGRQNLAHHQRRCRFLHR